MRCLVARIARSLSWPADRLQSGSLAECRVHTAEQRNSSVRGAQQQQQWTEQLHNMWIIALTTHTTRQVTIYRFRLSSVSVRHRPVSSHWWRTGVVDIFIAWSFASLCPLLDP